MKTQIFLLALLLCLIAVNARHMDTVDGTEDEQNHAVKAKENGGERHRRKRYHMSYGYDYQPPANPFYHPYRREYDRNQDLLPEIYRLLDEISTYIRRPPPPPPPQPIYIPYAVPYPMCNCESKKETPKNPDITSRFPDMDDVNQNWGIIDDGSVEEEGDGSRPLSFIPIISKRPTSRPPIPLDHGTQQSRAPPATQAPLSRPHVPDMCDVFSLSCCSGTPSTQSRCFAEAGCSETYNKGNACEQQRLLKIIDEYTKAYAPTVN